MASSYSTDLKLELMVTGENAGTWGDKTNTNLNLLQQAIAGYESVTLSSGATTALAMTNAQLSNARNMIIKFATITAGASTVCTIPDGIEKFYIFDCTAVSSPTNLTIKTASGTGFTPDAQKIYAAYSDGTNLTEVSLDTLGGTIGSAQIADNAITTAKISNANVTTAKIDDNAITTAKISQSQVTQSKMATDSVGPAQLIATGVSAGNYTSATITVDADGRISAASAGSSGPTTQMQVKAGYTSGSGTYTANATATVVGAFMRGGGGGPGGNWQNGALGTRGGLGGFGYFETPISQPYSQPYSVGSGGNQGPYQAVGNAGGATTIANLGTANGGPGGPAAQFGGNQANYGASPGSAPGALVGYPPVSQTYSVLGANFTSPSTLDGITGFTTNGPFGNSPTAPYDFGNNTKIGSGEIVPDVLSQSPTSGGGNFGGGGPAGQGTAGKTGFLLILEDIGPKELSDTI